MYKRYWLALVLMAILSPLGLLNKETAWGEWTTEELATMVGLVPKGIESVNGWWQALFQGYSVSFLGKGQFADVAGYAISALLGALIVYSSTLMLVKLLTNRRTTGDGWLG
jgi:hypothetical protein